MRYVIITILASMLIFSHSQGQSVKEIDSDLLAALCSKQNDTTYVINFWATWCSPCVKEISYFEELHRQYDSREVKVILVSLDFPGQTEKRVLPFLKEKEISAEVLQMTDLDYNSWIDRIEPSWSGAIPATLIYHRENRVFLEQEVARDELFSLVSQIKR
ncbi:MAG: TlpA family protein disulfide reductase [Bacteroidales bacterium]|nr:TlpA family protein disulfide reductase [Bacteroidales bacterium]